ncbi:hypothetical protein COLO4_05121 [Corchorus olitorius]|uniref:Uncharacterized protein n=1 Tax=Corchorus olitorius TaxID=93759 RepID=A0A1R3KRS8_9ROSI|nr:hypothetical protein COLO4_05121 [Corchorus olitorius]
MTENSVRLLGITVATSKARNEHSYDFSGGST